MIFAEAPFTFFNFFILSVDKVLAEELFETF